MWPALSMADPRSIDYRPSARNALASTISRNRERQLGGTLCRRLAADLPQGADLHMARTDRVRTVLTMAASLLLHTAHRSCVLCSTPHTVYRISGVVLKSFFKRRKIQRICHPLFSILGLRCKFAYGKEAVYIGFL